MQEARAWRYNCLQHLKVQQHPQSLSEFYQTTEEGELKQLQLVQTSLGKFQGTSMDYLFVRKTYNQHGKETRPSW